MAVLPRAFGGYRRTGYLAVATEASVVPALRRILQNVTRGGLQQAA